MNQDSLLMKWPSNDLIRTAICEYNHSLLIFKLRKKIEFLKISLMLIFFINIFNKFKLF